LNSQVGPFTLVDASALSGSHGATIDASGRNVSVEIRGGAGDDILKSGGGNDFLKGGAGDDEYHIDSASDLIVDSGGFDTVVVAFNGFGLGQGVGVDKLILDGSGLTGSGDGFDNVIASTGVGSTMFGGD